MQHIKFLLTASVLLFFVSSAGAAAPPPTQLAPGTVVNFRLKGIRQNLNNEEIRPDVFQSTIREVRITNQEVLRAIQIKNILPVFPKGTRLIANGGGLQAVAPNGLVLATAPITTIWSSPQFFQSQKTTTPPDWILKQNARSHASTVAMNLGVQFNFSLHGLLTNDSTQQSAMMILKVRLIFSNLVGTGQVDSVPFLFVGEITGYRPAAALI